MDPARIGRRRPARIYCRRSGLGRDRARTSALDHLRSDANPGSRHAHEQDSNPLRDIYSDLHLPFSGGGSFVTPSVYPNRGAGFRTSNLKMFELIVAGFMFMALIFYAVTGDADYGGGMWDLLATGPRAGAQRDAIERAIGPIWEADHVWLILIVVILFTAFPPAFAAMMTALNIPFTLMLIGIILRGSAFIFRKYDIKSHEVKQGWSLLFGAASFFTPFIQGVVLGALSTGQIRIADGRVVSGFFAGWLTPFAFACGLFALALFTFLAATYLTVDPSTESHVQNDFRLRALCSGAALVPIAFVVFITSKEGAPEMYHGLTQWWAPLLIGVTLVCAIAALASLWLRRFVVARFAAIAEVTLILTGWSLAQYPRLIAPDITIFNAAAPETTLRLLTYAVVAGAIVLFPSLFFLFRVFKGFSKE